MAQVHATCIAVGGRGILLTGASGAGKSDLALRMIDRGALLIADDITLLEARAGRLHAACPPTIKGKIEVRGIGIVAMASAESAEVALCVTLDAPPERMPPDPLPTVQFEGIAIPHIALAPFEATSPLKLEQALVLYGLPA